MGFWIFMLLMVLLTPLIMIVFGAIFAKKPPTTINEIYGYRTTMSMKNTETWIFAQQYFGRLFFIFGIVTIIPSVIPMFFVIHREIDTIGSVSGIIIFLQCVLLFVPIIFTEKALKTKFDEYGRKR